MATVGLLIVFFFQSRLSIVIDLSRFGSRVDRKNEVLRAPSLDTIVTMYWRAYCNGNYIN